MKVSKGGKIKIAAAVVLAVAIFHYIYSNYTEQASVLIDRGNSYQLVETGASVTYDFNSQAQFYSPGAKGFFSCTKDGIDYVSVEGDVKWSEIFSLTAPIMVGEGSIVAVSEPNGRYICVFDQNGKLFEKQFDEPILSFAVNKEGWLSVIIKKGVDYNVLAYHKSGGEPVFTWNHQDRNIFPVASDISDDGRFIAISYMDISISIGTKLAFMYINEADSRGYEDGLFAAKNKEEEVISIVKFMENNTLIAVSDKEINCYAVEDNGVVADKWSLALSNEISQLGFFNGRSFALALGEVFLNQEGKPPGTVLFYNMSGANTGEYSLGRNATFLNMGLDSAIIGQGRRFHAVNNRGELLWEYNASQDVQQLIFLDNKDRVLLVGTSQADVLTRTRAKEAARGEEASEGFDAEEAWDPNEEDPEAWDQGEAGSGESRPDALGTEGLFSEEAAIDGEDAGSSAEGEGTGESE